MRITNHSFIAPTITNKKGVKTEEKVQTDKVNGTKEMSQADEMAAFKKEFYDELSQITNHQTVSNMAVNVSEKAFQEMKADPAYKEKVLSLIKRDCQSSYGTRNCSVSITVGASTEEYRADSWPVGYDSEFHTRSQNSFYKRTSEKTDEAEVLQTRYAENRLQAMRLQQTLDAKRNMDQAEFSKANLAAVRERNIEFELQTESQQ